MKHYSVPKEINNLIHELDAFYNLRDAYIKRPFGFKKAVKCTLLAERKRGEFWGKIVKLYPQLEHKILRHSLKGYVYIVEDEE